MLEAPSTLASPCFTSAALFWAGSALSHCSALNSSKLPPPTYDEAIEVPKKPTRFRPADALHAITAKAQPAADLPAAPTLVAVEVLREGAEKRQHPDRIGDRKQRGPRFHQVHTPCAACWLTGPDFRARPELGLARRRQNNTL